MRLSQGHNDVMSSTGIEPATLRSLARRFNKLIDVAAFLLLKKMHKLFSSVSNQTRDENPASNKSLTCDQKSFAQNYLTAESIPTIG